MSVMSGARISVASNLIQITGKAPIREPIFNMQVVVDCAYTPHLQREYTMMVDPIKQAPAAQLSVTNTNTSDSVSQEQSAAPVASENRRTAAQTRARVERSPIAMNARYQIQPGDSISTIVARIENRSMGLWSAVDRVFAANPDAFVDQDINRLMVGSELIIPNLNGYDTAATESPTTSATSTIDEPTAILEPAADFTAVANAQAVAEVSSQPTTETVEEIPAPAATPVVEEASAVIDQTSDLRPGDVVMTSIGSDGADAAIPDTVIDIQPVPTPVVPVVNSSVSADSGISGAWNWLIWLAGTGVALIVALLLFGRKIRDRFARVAAVETGEPSATTETEKPQNIVADVDFEFEDTISAEAISLDADLGAGTGLESSVQMDVAEDFTFSAAGEEDAELDLELTAESSREPEPSPTDIIPPNHREELPSILDEEEPAIDDDEEYDLSMIVDATKQPLDQYDATAKDLQAVQVESSNAATDDGDYTMSNAVDCHTLEQDYEDELTATQALNIEIEKAAMQLVERMDENDSIGETVEMPAKSDPDVTAELAINQPSSIEAENDPEADSDQSDATVQMSSAGSDITVEMTVESGKVDTKQLKRP